MLRFDVSLKTSLIRIRRVVLDTPEKKLRMPPTSSHYVSKNDSTTEEGECERLQYIQVSFFSGSESLQFLLTALSVPSEFKENFFSLHAFLNFVIYLLLFDIIIMYMCFFIYHLSCSIEKHHVAWIQSYYNYFIFH